MLTNSKTKKSWRLIYLMLSKHLFLLTDFLLTAQIKRSEDEKPSEASGPATKKPRLVFTDQQRKALQAAFLNEKRPNKELQVCLCFLFVV